MAKVYRFPWGVRADAQVVIVDCGSKSTPLIAQLLREIELASVTVPWQEFDAWWAAKTHAPKLVILSGGDQSVYELGAPRFDRAVHQNVVATTAVLGICYGAQYLAHWGGGEVERAARAEYGVVLVDTVEPFGFYRGGEAVMNHGDEIVMLPPGWKRIASTEHCRYAFAGAERTWGVQFHPEMGHTDNGAAILRHMAYTIAGCVADCTFDPALFVVACRSWLASIVPEGDIICGLSAGVDSSVAFRIAEEPYERRLRGLFIDTGWCREEDPADVMRFFPGEHVSIVHASGQFHTAIEGIPYPSDGPVTEREHAYYDRVRKAIGGTFIDVFLSAVPDRGEPPVALIQGTNAADIVESNTGLKAHHNVGGLPAELGVDIIEPLAGLYKSEIRTLAVHLGFPEELAYRQPFPGPGLAIRAWGKLNRDYAPVLRRANQILEEVVRKHYPRIEDRPCQYYVALLPAPSTGLMGDARVTGFAWWVRMVASRARENYATVTAFYPTQAFQEELSQRLTAEVRMRDGTRFCRVGYETTGKPPSTTEPH